MAIRHSRLESDLQESGYHLVAGIDEAGRGPLAGPVVAAACLIPSGVRLKGIKDSKQLTPDRRKELFWQIISRTLVGVGVVDWREIDRINILQASLAAMRLAVQALSATPEILLIDGPMKIKNLPIEQIPVIQGDQKLICVGAASIVAKVTRDQIMENYDLEYPNYGFRFHKGYPTEEHVAALDAYGPCPIHRMSFGPLLRFLPEVCCE